MMPHFSITAFIHTITRITRLRVRYLLAMDLVLILCAFFLSCLVRFEANQEIWPFFRQNWHFLLLAVVIRLPLYFVLRLYYRLWRYASLQEGYRILLAGCVASALLYFFNFLLFPLFRLPIMTSRSIWLLEGVFALLSLAGSRVCLRVLLEAIHPTHLLQTADTEPVKKRTLIVGAGDAGALLARQLHTNPASESRVVGFIDDDPAKFLFTLNGMPIFGDRDAIPAVVAKHQISQIIIALPSAPGRDLREIVQICERAGIKPRTLPSLHELLNNQVDLSKLRNVGIEDLLRREPVKTDKAAVAQMLQGRRVLVTGGGGSIGSELCRQILRSHPASLVLLGHGENSIFEIYHELKRELTKLNWSDVQLHACIADIRFSERIQTAFAHFQPEIVFHAAAHKHVPLMEENPAEAITNNILGTQNVLAAAEKSNVEHFVMISTDKAVNPTSIMGASKRVAELLVHQTAMRTQKAYVAVRFGNVLGSRGSVVLTFQQQIANGGPVTVTDPEMKRYFMIIPEAVQLVLQAAVLGRGGEVFLLDMGEPVKIVDLASDLIRLAGLEVGRDIDIVFSGLRPGEKLFEELFTKEEVYERTYHQKIFIAANACKFIPSYLNEVVSALAVSAQKSDKLGILRSLQNLIPEFQPEALAKASDTIKTEPQAHPIARPELSRVST